MSFWEQFEQAGCLPNDCNCELISSALIRQPLAFWSSLAYIFFGVVLYKTVKKKSFDLTIWTKATIILALSSMAAHGTFVKLAMAMDFAAIFLILSFFAFLRMLKWLNCSNLKIYFFFVFYFFIVTIAMYSLEKWTKIIFSLFVFVFTFSELFSITGWSFLKSRYLQYSITVLFLSFALFLMDEFKIGCDPLSVWQLHSFWHIGTAVSIFFYGKWRFSLSG